MLPFIWSLCLQQHTKFWKVVNATLTEYWWLAVVNQLWGEEWANIRRRMVHAPFQN